MLLAGNEYDIYTYKLQLRGRPLDARVCVCVCTYVHCILLHLKF